MATAVLQAIEGQGALPLATAPTSKLQDCVLLIEDDPDAMLLVQNALHEHGHGKYRLVWANNLSSGLSQLGKTRVDVVVLDLGLPESSGPASYAWVREVSPDVPVVVLTADTREETESSVLASGVEDYLTKDQISGSVLLQCIQSAISANKQRPASTATTVVQQCSAALNGLPRPVGPGQLQKCVLLIEDSEDAMSLVQYALQTYGRGQYRLVWASSLNDGLGHLTKDGVDLVLLDLGLPESSGVESYAWVREISPVVPVVVLSGDPSVETEFQLLESGIEDYLVKDQVSGSLLMQSIQSALSPREQCRDSNPMSPKAAI